MVNMYQNGVSVILVDAKFLSHQFVGSLEQAYQWAERNCMKIIDLRHEGSCYCGI